MSTFVGIRRNIILDSFNDKHLQDKLLEEFMTKYQGEQNLHTPGVKDDGGKPDCDLVMGEFSRALLEVTKVGTFGAKKYTESGWVKVPRGFRRYSSAMQRHYFLSKEHELDLESGLPHLAHMAWCALASLELALRYKEENEEVNLKYE